MRVCGSERKNERGEGEKRGEVRREERGEDESSVTECRGGRIERKEEKRGEGSKKKELVKNGKK